MSRIGIYSGTFNPVHAGHIAFALQAMEAAKLTELYFLPERRPRHKPGVEHFGHRVAMLRRAIKPHKHFDLIELDDTNFSVRRTLPELQKRFPNDQLIFLFGSDSILHMAEWPYVERLFASCELVIGRRKGQTVKAIKEVIASWSKPPVVTLLNSFAPDVSSTAVRQALEQNQAAKGLLKSVAKYSNHHWLYISLKNVAERH